MKKIEILKTALESRNDEIDNYQINIDNYTRAISKINDSFREMPEIIAFRDNLQHLLNSSKIEQLKAIIIRDVIKEQLEELEDS